MNSKYRATLYESKRLNGSGLLQKANASNITADKILYDHAIKMVCKIFLFYFAFRNKIIVKFSFYSVSQLHWMNYLEIHNNAS